MNETDISQFRKQKMLSLAACIVDTASTIIRSAKDTYPPKRAFGKIDRRPLKRLNKQRARLRLIIAAPMGALQVAMIASQPTPRFPTGAPGTTGNPAIIGEMGSEIIFKP
jgi:hypothetical protein